MNTLPIVPTTSSISTTCDLSTLMYTSVNHVQKQTIQGKLRIHSIDLKVVTDRGDFFNVLNRNRGFGMFVTSMMIETV
jgi:hypothetical protein